MLKRVISLLIVFTLLFSTVVFAEEDNTITVEKAVEMALEDQSAIEDLDDAIEGLWDSYYAAKAGKSQIESTLDALDDYEELYDKKFVDKETLSVAESYELLSYQAMFGDEPPKYTNQEMLDKFIKPRDFGYKAAYAEIQKLKNTKKTIEPSLEKGVRDLYNQVVSLTNTLSLQESYFEISSKQHSQLVLKQELGQVSSEEIIVSELNLSILSMQINQLSNSLDTLEMNFNKLIEEEVTYKHILTDTITSEIDLFNTEAKHKALEIYLTDAIKNRSEVKNARIALGVKEREDSIIKNYLSNELLTDRINAEIALVQAEYDLLQAEASVKDNVTDGYIDMMTYWNDYLISVSSYDLAVKSYEDMKNRYDLGQVADVDLSLVEYQVKIAKNTVENNLRNYLNSVDQMENASGIGPAY